MQSTPGRIFSRRHIKIFFLFFPEIGIWHFMQIGDNLHKISKTFFSEKNKKIITSLSAAELAKHMSHNFRKRSVEHVRPAKIQISLRIRADWSESSLSAFGIAKDTKFFSCGQRRLWSDCTDAQVIWVFVGRTCQKVLFPTLRLTHDLNCLWCSYNIHFMTRPWSIVPNDLTSKALKYESSLFKSNIYVTEIWKHSGNAKRAETSSPKATKDMFKNIIELIRFQGEGDNAVKDCLLFLVYRFGLSRIWRWNGTIFSYHRLIFPSVLVFGLNSCVLIYMCNTYIR